MMKYENFNFNGDENDFENLLKKSKDEDIPKILVSALNNLDNLNWLQNILIEYTKNEDFWIAKTAINLLSDLARIYGNEINKEMILKKLKGMERADLKNVINETLEDIEIFTN